MGEPDAGAVAISETALVEKEFGFPLDQLYKKAVAYYKENEKEGHLVVSYDDRLKFMAYSKQVRLGPYQESHNDAGWFDITGNDRTKAWQSLGQLDREEAMAGFVFLLDRVCPPFKQFVLDSIEAPPTKSDESELRVLNGHGGDPQLPSSFSASAQQPPVDCRIYESQKKQIQEALNAQTYHQFRAYAQQQIQGAPEQQEALIKQLQEQHYQQYMAQVYAQHASQAHSQNMSEEGAGGVVLPPNDPKRRSDEERNRDEDSDVSDEEPGDDLPSKHPSQTKPTTGTNAIATSTANTEVIPPFIAKDDNRPQADGFVKDFTNILDASGVIDAQHTTTTTGLSFTNAAGEPDIDRPVEDILDYKPPDSGLNWYLKRHDAWFWNASLLITHANQMRSSWIKFDEPWVIPL